MKKLLAILLFAISIPVFAQHRHHGHHGFRHYPYGSYWQSNHGWVVPAIIGGVVTYEIVKNQNPPVVVQQPPVIIQSPTQVCTEWKEIQQSDGKIYRERTCSQ